MEQPPFAEAAAVCASVRVALSTRRPNDARDGAAAALRVPADIAARAWEAKAVGHALQSARVCGVCAEDADTASVRAPLPAAAIAGPPSVQQAARVGELLPVGARGSTSRAGFKLNLTLRLGLRLRLVTGLTARAETVRAGRVRRRAAASRRATAPASCSVDCVCSSCGAAELQRPQYQRRRTARFAGARWLGAAPA